MVRSRLFAAVLAGSTFALPAAAQTLEEALVAAYNNNPTLLAQRAQLRATDEGVPQALAGWRPTVTFSSEFGKSRQDFDPNSASRPDETLTPFANTLSVNQPLYRGGRTEASVQSAEALVRAGRAQLDATEQTVFLQVITAYLDVLRDQRVVELNQNNVQRLERQLEATQDRFRVGEITRTDVAQAEARLERAKSDRTTAEGTLAASRATFQRVVGEPPRSLVLPASPAGLPPSLDRAQAIAADENPDLVAALHREDSSRYDIRAASGALLPSISLNGALSRNEETTVGDLTTSVARVTAQVTVPLYEAGSVYSQVRQRRQTNNQRRIQIDETRRLVGQNVTQAWEALVTARANIVSRQAQVEANSVALDGVTQEAQVGARTTLDVLDAQQELLDAEVALVRARRDEHVAAVALLQTIGWLSAERLKLPVDYYDPAAHYGEVRNKWFGTDGGLD